MRGPEFLRGHRHRHRLVGYSRYACECRRGHTVTDVNEPPTMIVGQKAVSVDERITGSNATPIDANRMDDVDTTNDPYTSSDPEEGDLTWSVSGTDGDYFEFATPTTGTLTFKATAGPDYEKPADANNNNVYEITLEVSDGTNTAKMDVNVTVKNVQETPGTVNFSHSQPRVGRSFTANLTDLDGDISSAKWQWSINDSGCRQHLPATSTGPRQRATPRRPAMLAAH